MIPKLLSRRPSGVRALLPRIPVAALGVVIAASALQASCGGETDIGPLDNLVDGGRADGPDPDAASPPDAPSEDSREDRADGMSYGDGYGKEDAPAFSDAHEPDDGP